MEDCNEQKFVSVDEDYLAELERKAKKSEWQRGYIEGFDAAMRHAESASIGRRAENITLCAV